MVIFGWVGILPYQTPVTLKVMGVDPKRYFNSDMLLHMKFKMLSKTEFWGFAPEPYSGTLWVDLFILLGPTMW